MRHVSPPVDAPTKTNVLLMNDHLGWNGSVLHGVARLFLSWIPHFDSQRFSVKVCILRKKDALHRHFEEKGIEVIYLGRSKFSPLTLLDMVRIVREHEIHVMHAQGYGASNFGRLTKAVTGVPVVIHLHDTSPYYPWYQRLADGMLNRLADRMIAVSSVTKEFCLSNRNMAGIEPDQIRVLHNCVSIDDFAPPSETEVERARERLGVGPSSTVVGTVTRLYESKGNAYLLEAAAEIVERFQETRFVIVGDGPEMASLRELCAEKKLGNHVIFTGFCDEVASVLAAFDIMVIASYGAEGLPLTILEAMAMGKPSVVTDIIEVIDDGVTGLVVPPRDSRALAGAFVRLIEDRVFRREMGRNAARKSSDYDVRAYVRTLEDIYRDLAHGHEASPPAP